MITIKSVRELKGMQASGRLLASMFEGLRDVIEPLLKAVVVAYQNKVLRATNMVLVFQSMTKLLMQPHVRTLF